MVRLSFAVVSVLTLLDTAVLAKDVLLGLPPPVADIARQYAAECRSAGLGELLLTEGYRVEVPGLADVNGDAKPDYAVYKCMFGCSAKPNAFEGTGTPCAWGNLLLSGESGYQSMFVPGLVSRAEAGPPIRIAISKPRALRLSGNFCAEGYPENNQQQVFELRDGRFRLVDACPDEGCVSLLQHADQRFDTR